MIKQFIPLYALALIAIILSSIAVFNQPQTPTQPLSGVDGQDGINGTDGINGVDGALGQKGANGIDGVDGTDGINGLDGKDGVNGTNGTVGPAGTPATKYTINNTTSKTQIQQTMKDAFKTGATISIQGQPKTYTKMFKGEEFAPNTAFTILNQTGPGCVKKIWLQTTASCDLKITVDGKTAMNTNNGTIGGLNDNRIMSFFNGGYWSWTYAYGETYGHFEPFMQDNFGAVGSYAGYRAIDIPYIYNVSIDVINNHPSLTAIVYSDVQFQDLTQIINNDIDTPLKCARFNGVFSYKTFPTLQPNTTLNIANIEGKGYLQSVCMSMQPTAGGHIWYMEDNALFTIDNEASPSWSSNGLETFFMATNYGEEITDLGTNFALAHSNNYGCTFFNQTYNQVSMYRMFNDDPVAFNSNLRFDLHNYNPNTALETATLIIYYTYGE